VTTSFGRERETVESALHARRGGGPAPGVLGIQALVSPRLHRRACWLRSNAKPGPRVQTQRWIGQSPFHESRRWCFLALKPGTEPLKALVESFFDTWQLGGPIPSE